MAISRTTSLHLQNSPTWGELRRFVEMARDIYSDDDTIDMERHSGDPSVILTLEIGEFLDES